MKIELEREEDGRWLAEVPDLSGVMSYGETRDDAVSRVKALALRVLADRLEHGEAIPVWPHVSNSVGACHRHQETGRLL